MKISCTLLDAEAPNAMTQQAPGNFSEGILLDLRSLGFTAKKPSALYVAEFKLADDRHTSTVYKTICVPALGQMEAVNAMQSMASAIFRVAAQAIKLQALTVRYGLKKTAA